MIQEATDFQAESQALYELTGSLTADDYDHQTGFKQWTINEILAHLHFFNRLADLTLTDEAAFRTAYGEYQSLIGQPGATMRTVTDQLLGQLHGASLRQAWFEYLNGMVPRWRDADPKQRLPWVGPTMSARSSITARLMETWAHGQAIYDLLGVERQEQDRIRSVAVIGVNTFGWTFKNRHLPVPAEPPHIRLTSPGGDVWTWHPESDSNRIEGSAVAFCQVVTQVRHVDDTTLELTGETARRWMAIAQCFAGPPQDPPAPGTRYRQPNPMRHNA